MLTDQWFVAMNTRAPDSHAFVAGKSFKDICLLAVNGGLDGIDGGGAERIDVVPEHWTSTYNHWLENVHD